MTVVVPPGNDGDNPRRKMIDTLPAMWASTLSCPGLPLIVAGSVEDEGALVRFSEEFSFPLSFTLSR